MPKNPKYIPIITSLRGLAATLVCFYHFVLSTSGYVENELIRSIFYYGQCGVPMFFVISGVVLPLAMLKRNYRIEHFPRFILRRLVRLEPPYLASIVVALGYLYLQGYRHGGETLISSSNLLLHLGYMIPFVEGEEWLNPIYWTLAVEFQYYLFLAVAFVALTHENIIWRVLVYILMLSAGFVVTSKAFICVWMPVFLLGILYVLYQYEKIKKVEYFMVSILSVWLGQYFVETPNMIMVTATLLLIHHYPDFNNKWTSWVGKVSYSLYLLHYIIGQALVNYLSHFYVQSYQKVIVVLIGYIVSLVGAWLLYRLVERPSSYQSSKLL